MRDPARTALLALALGLGLTLAGTAPSPADAKPAAKAAAKPAKPAAKRPAKPSAKPAAKPAPPAEEPMPEAVAQVAAWVTASGDNRGLPFVVIDKVNAKVFVFEVDGELKGASPALLGLTRGDESVPGVGEKKLSALKAHEKTTPAGRFLAAYGPAAGGRRVLWIDYDTAISLHPVVTSNPKEQRTKRLRSASPDDNRITYGCINVSTTFYQQVVRKTFRGTEGIVYILPERRSLAEAFPAMRAFAAINGALAEGGGSDGSSLAGADAALVQ
jgi:hypothetical protein